MYIMQYFLDFLGGVNWYLYLIFSWVKPFEIGNLHVCNAYQRKFRGRNFRVTDF